MRDPAFESQVFAQNSSRRQEAYILAQGQALGEGLPGIVDSFSRGRDAAVRYQREKLAAGIDQLRQDAMVEDAQWTRELHSINMLNLQHRQMAAQTALIEAQTRRQLEEADDRKRPRVAVPRSRDEILAIEASGLALDVTDGIPSYTPIPNDRRDAARRELDRIRAADEEVRRDAIRVAEEGHRTRAESAAVARADDAAQTELNTLSRQIAQIEGSIDLGWTSGESSEDIMADLEQKKLRQNLLRKQLGLPQEKNRKQEIMDSLIDQILNAVREDPR